MTDKNESYEIVVENDNNDDNNLTDCNETSIIIISRKKEILVDKLKRFSNFINSLNENSNINQVKLRIQAFEPWLGKFEDLNLELEILTGVNEDKEREMFEQEYFSLLSQGQTFLDINLIKNGSNSLGAFKHDEIKLPRIELPKFSGDYEEWQSFCDLFGSSVHNNSTISNVQKFQYLNSCLQGEALKVISALDISEKNYNLAWELLNNRYNNVRQIVNNHIKKLYSLSNVNKESYTFLRQFLDNVLKHTRALSSLKVPVEHWDSLLIFILSNKLDLVSKRDWEALVAKKVHTELPQFEEFIKFLEQKCRLLETVHSFEHSHKITSVKADIKGKSTKFNSLVATVNVPHQCDICGKEPHKIYACRKFLDSNVQQRWKLVKSKKVCFNCLAGGHASVSCTHGSCKKCNKKHSTLLHHESNSSQNQSSGRQDSSTSNCQTNVHNISNSTEISHSYHVSNSHTSSTSQILLSTAKVIVMDKNGQDQVMRVLLDSASQIHLITRKACQRLLLTPQPTKHTVAGFGCKSEVINEEISITIFSCDLSYSKTIHCLVVERITEDLPQGSFQKKQIKIPHNLLLADPTFNLTGSIDLLLGTEIFFDILNSGHIKSFSGSPVLQETRLGWIVSGRVNIKKSVTQPITSISQYSLSFVTLEKRMEEFWQVEEIEERNKFFSHEERECEEHFIKHLSRDAHGHFIVRLPFNHNKGKLGNSQNMALKRLLGIEKKLAINIDLQNSYRAFMREYIELGHMKVLKDIPKIHYFMPHHAVIKPDSTTSKIRVVFDASAATSTGVSLNQVLKKGPVIQDNLFDILLRFRIHNVVVTADITKMYRQIHMNDEDANYQLIYWRDVPSDPLQVYKLQTVTYGTTTAPFLATRCLEQISIEQEIHFPLASKIIKDSFYVDDLLAGFESKEIAQKTIADIDYILNSYNLPLRKWRSNTPNVVPFGNECDTSLKIDPTVTVKTLGLLWNSEEDSFTFFFIKREFSSISKRNILSVIASLYDPLGFLGPVITKSKLIMQKLWKNKIDWDEDPGDKIRTEWLSFYNELDKLNLITIPRKFTAWSFVKNLQIHGFCDASQVAYGSCIYIRTTNFENKHSIRLLCSKSRIAPLKSISLPRLELCGALLMSKLVKVVIGALKIDIDQIYLWTDSTIVMAWLNMQPSHCKPFIANRISKIQNLTEGFIWNHVPGLENPADLISRGKFPSEMINNVFWFEGSEWLKSDESKWPHSSNSCQSFTNDMLETNKEFQSLCTHITKKEIELNIPFNKFSSLTKLQRVMAYFLRFANKLLHKDSQRGTLALVELQRAMLFLIQKSQQESFSNEIDKLKRSLPLGRSSNIRALNPFLDSDGFLRIGGRIQRANIAQDQKHPFLISPNHPLAKLIILHEHIKNMHAGVQHTLSLIQLKFWLPKGKNLVKKLLRNCVVCFKVQPRCTIPLMGNLPAHRVRTAKTFEITGVDFAGPFSIKESHRKGKVHISKGYIAVFVCFVTKAAHLELVSSLTSDAFIATLRRFLSRRGNLKHLYSDNATNFHGANNKISEMFALLCKDEAKIVNECHSRGIKWHFIPARSPNFGGLWENLVKGVKRHLTKVIGETILTFEEYVTLLNQIEFCLNTRPLTPLPDDPKDSLALTPNHFLIGDLTETHEILPDPDLTTMKINRLTRWQHLQQMKQHFWNRWSQEYLATLQQRNKWTNFKPNLKEGDVVLVRNEQTTSSRWPLGLVIAVFKGADQQVRVVDVKLQNSIIRRAANQLIKLPIDI